MAANFDFVAQTADGRTQKGTITAHDKEAALQSLRSRQLRPVIIREMTAAKGLNMNIKLPGSGGVKAKEMVIFTRQFSTMIGAGVPIMRALTILKSQTTSATFREVLESITSDVESGASLSDAFGKHPKVFSSIYINMVKAGETGGILDQVLDRLAYQQEKDSAIKSKIKSAMTYPVVIGVVMVGAMVVLMTAIVPQIGGILVDMGGELPIYTRALLAISNFMTQPLFIIGMLVVLPLLAVYFRRYIKTPAGRYQWHSLLLRVPVVRDVIIKTAIARFSRIFASLMSAGVSIIDAIDTTAGAIGNAVIEKELRNCSHAVSAGGQFSTELEKTKHFPLIVSQMLAVGEETGQTDTVILKIAEFYEQEVDDAVSALSSIIEPVMIVCLGGMVGLIAVSVMGPITQISSGVE